jgi:hypothetical protein
MKSMGNIPFHPDSVRIFNELITPNEYCDSHYEPEIVDEDDRFFGTHIREVIKTFKEIKSGK